MFKVIPVLYQKKAEAENAEVNIAQLAYTYTKGAVQRKRSSLRMRWTFLAEAKLLKAQANWRIWRGPGRILPPSERPFDGIIDRLQCQQGSLVQEGDVLTTMSDNSVMWVYFAVPEARYLEYMADPNQQMEDLQIELVLASGNKFPHVGKFGARIEAGFNNQTGGIPFRADFPNPDRLLRHGQSGTVLIRKVLTGAASPSPNERRSRLLTGKRYTFTLSIKTMWLISTSEIVIQNESEERFCHQAGACRRRQDYCRRGATGSRRREGAIRGSLTRKLLHDDLPIEQRSRPGTGCGSDLKFRGLRWSWSERVVSTVANLPLLAPLRAACALSIASTTKRHEKPATAIAAT